MIYQYIPSVKKVLSAHGQRADSHVSENFHSRTSFVLKSVVWFSAYEMISKNGRRTKEETGVFTINLNFPSFSAS